MKYRPFGKTGVSVSEIGLGTWQLGSADWGNIDESDAIAILQRSVDLGVNFIDTADVYGMGHSERTIGKFLKQSGHDLHVVTKLGRRHDEPNGWPQNFTLDVMRRHVQDSLTHLGVDSIFLEQLHCIPTEELRRGEVFDHLRTLKQEGLIQHWGVSVETVEEGLICLEHDDCASLQVIYNIFRQKLTDELLPQAKAKNVAIIARVPLASGLLAGKFTADHAFDTSDHRNYNANGECFNVGETFAGVPFDKGVELANQAKAILSPTESVPMAQQALRWILDNDAVSTVIPGAGKLSQAESNAAASDLAALSDDVHAELRSLYASAIKTQIRGAY